MSREFLIIGDSNVRRFHLKLGTQLKDVEFVQARTIEEVTGSLQAINTAYKFVVFAFITNLIVTASEEGSTPQERLNAIGELFSCLLPLIK